MRASFPKILLLLTLVPTSMLAWSATHENEVGGDASAREDTLADNLNGHAVLVEPRRYGPRLIEANWELEEKDGRCLMRQDIPYYGKAMFVRTPEEMSFLLHTDQGLEAVSKSTATIQAMPAVWRHDDKMVVLPEVGVAGNHTAVAMGNIPARILLSQLEAGRSPEFRFHEFEGEHGALAVSVSAVKFLPVYAKFLACEKQVLAKAGVLGVHARLGQHPDDGEAEVQVADLALDVTGEPNNAIMKDMVHFDTGKWELKPDAQKALNDMIYYLKVHPEVKTVLISGHTDAVGGAGSNLKLSLDRARSVRRYLTTAGIPETKIRTRFFGEYLPLRGNETAPDRAINRRVRVHLIQ